MPISRLTKQSNKNLEWLYNRIVVRMVARLVVCNAGITALLLCPLKILSHQTRPDQTRPDNQEDQEDLEDQDGQDGQDDQDDQDDQEGDKSQEDKNQENKNQKIKETKIKETETKKEK